MTPSSRTSAGSHPRDTVPARRTAGGTAGSPTASSWPGPALEVGASLLNTAGARPALLQRFPHGATGKSFFQKRVPSGAPTWLETTTVTTPNGTTSHALVVADIAHVVWAVNLGCLGLHLWPYEADDPAHADELRIDLAPQPGRGFDDVRAAAGHVRALLEEIGIVGYPKTSGNRGVHVYV